MAQQSHTDKVQSLDDKHVAAARIGAVAKRLVESHLFTVEQIDVSTRDGCEYICLTFTTRDDVDREVPTPYGEATVIQRVLDSNANVRLVHTLNERDELVFAPL
jgi:hypothetical protein